MIISLTKTIGLGLDMPTTRVRTRRPKTFIVIRQKAGSRFGIGGKDASEKL